jgi:hypothetical protein
MRKAKRSAPGGFAGRGRHWMAADHYWKWRLANFGGDDQPVADAPPQPARGRFGHPPRGFPDRETDVVRAFRPAFGGPHSPTGRGGLHDVVALERARDEHTRIDGTNAGVSDGQQI